MRNPKNFDFDKKKPITLKQCMIKSDTESNNDDINKSPFIKGVEITQITSNNRRKSNKSFNSYNNNNNINKTSLSKNKKKNNTSKISFKKTADKKEKPISDNISNISEIKKTKNSTKYSQKDDIDIIIPTLPESEIISPEEPLPEEGKLPNPNFCKNYVSTLLNPIKADIEPSILSGVEIGLNKILLNIQDDLEEKKFEINQETKSVNEIKNLNTNNGPIIGKPVANYEASIKMQKIKELSQRKKRIEKQINQIDENIRLIDEEKTTNFGSGRSFDFQYPSSIVEENIKKDQLKENKQTKELLLAKLNGINEQVQKLMEKEEELAGVKKFNVKEFLDNFEKDREKAEELTKKYDEEQKIREQKMMDSVQKGSDRRQKEYEQRLIEEERKKKELEKTRLRELERIRGRNKENLDKLNYIRQHVNDKPASVNEYLFKALENKYKEKAKNDIRTEILKHKEKIKENTVSLEEIFDFEKKQKELEMKRLAEMEEEKKKLKDQWKQTKDILPKFESSAMQIIKEEEKKNKEKKELEEFKKN